MDTDTFLRRIPKVELHVHLGGTVSPATYVDLARKHGIQLPPYDSPEDLYRFSDFAGFLQRFWHVSSCLREAADFERVAYEALAASAAAGVRYTEAHCSPLAWRRTGVDYLTGLNGLCAGVRAAEEDLGVQCRLIPALSRAFSPEICGEVLDTVLEHRRDEVIGIGLGGADDGAPIAAYAGLFDRAARAGLHRTGHAGELDPAANIWDSLDLLGCERIDHGYSVLQDEALTQRCLDEGTCFTVCPSSNALLAHWADMSTHPIAGMGRRGLRIMINTDDPTMFHTDMAAEYGIVAGAMGFTPAEIKGFVLNGLDGAWLDDSIRRQWRQQWSTEIDGLLAQLPAA